MSRVRQQADVRALSSNSGWTTGSMRLLGDIHWSLFPFKMGRKLFPGVPARAVQKPGPQASRGSTACARLEGRNQDRIVHRHPGTKQKLGVGIRTSYLAPLQQVHLKTVLLATCPARAPMKDPLGVFPKPV